uniref:C2H2-type domain-containing protein n=1 Tax=Rhabditophanes sp. KR3021 TaxID=114890 RepID=A0AC35TIV2_9BILA
MIAGLIAKDSIFCSKSKIVEDQNRNEATAAAFSSHFMNAAGLASLAVNSNHHVSSANHNQTIMNSNGIYSNGNHQSTHPNIGYGQVTVHVSSHNNGMPLFNDANAAHLMMTGCFPSSTSSGPTTPHSSHSPMAVDGTMNPLLHNQHHLQQQDHLNGISSLLNPQIKTEQPFDVSVSGLPPHSLGSFSQLPFPAPNNTTSLFQQMVHPHQGSFMSQPPFSALQNENNMVGSVKTPGRRARGNGDGQVKCRFCPKKFPNNEVLRTHMNDCRSLRLHECRECGKRFKARGGLQQHNRIHVQDRPYVCRFCPKRFNQKSHVDQHERIHTNSKPFQCQYCGRTFRQRSQQLGHENCCRNTRSEISPAK